MSARPGSGLRWSVKMNRSVTHRHRFNEKAIPVRERFRERFRPLDHLGGRDEAVDLGRRCAVEVRNPGVLGDDGACRRLQEAAILVSADSPEVQERIFPGVVIYLRVHGRGTRYRHDYTGSELADIRDGIIGAGPERAYLLQQRSRDARERESHDAPLCRGAPGPGVRNNLSPDPGHFLVCFIIRVWCVAGNRENTGLFKSFSANPGENGD